MTGIQLDEPLPRRFFAEAFVPDTVIIGSLIQYVGIPYGMMPALSTGSSAAMMEQFSHCNQAPSKMGGASWAVIHFRRHTLKDWSDWISWGSF
jgi:hypothetical protein